MFEKAMVFLRWGKLGMKIFAKRKKIYAFQKRFFYKKRKYHCLANAPAKKEQKGHYPNIKRSYAVLKAYCRYMKRLLGILKNRLK